MRDYYSIGYATQNENGDQQVTIEYQRTFWQWLFRLPNTKQAFVGSGTVWWHKGNGGRAGTHKEYEITEIIERLRQERVSIN